MLVSQYVKAQTQTTTPVTVFSPSEHLPLTLSQMDSDTLHAHIQKAKALIQHHKDVARNGEPAAERYYFFIPEVASDMAAARYTLSIMFAELAKRKPRVELLDEFNA